MSYIVPSATGVAYLAGTFTLEAGSFRFRPRMQPLWVPPKTPLIAVVRIESDNSDSAEVDRLASEIARVPQREPVDALQIDFDARASERKFYRNLMAGIRRNLPHRVALEMTALVSWCQDDDWIRGLPVADAVPMFFRMGVDAHSTSEHLRDRLCTSSIGISTDEFYVTIPRGRRVFVFSSRAWTESGYRAVFEASKKWFSNW